MPIEGELVVAIDWDGRRARRVDIVSTRPVSPARALIGKTPAEAVRSVGLLFSVCGEAQSVAARCALAAAGVPEFSAPAAEREAVLAVSGVQDGFWHLLIDWPSAMDSAPYAAPVAEARRLIGQAQRSSAATGPDTMTANRTALGAELCELAEQTLFGMPPGRWLELPDLLALGAWAKAGATLPARLLRAVLRQPDVGRSDIAAMPAITEAALGEVIAPALEKDAHFARAPSWAGLPVETGAFPRMRHRPLVRAVVDAHGNGAGARIVARMVEVAELLGELAVDVHPPRAVARAQALQLDGHAGIGAVETARGLLLHRARVVDGRVAEYQIVAPTEWNFHPGGALVRGLAGFATRDRDALARAARLCIHALDPCVAARLEIGHA